MKSERTGAALISEARQSPERWGHMASVNQTQGNLQKAIRSQPHAAAPTRWLLAPWPAGPTDALFRGLISLAEGNQGPSAGTFSGMVLEPGFRRTPLEMGRGPLRGLPARALGTGRAASSRGLAALGPQPATTAPPPLLQDLPLPSRSCPLDSAPFLCSPLFFIAGTSFAFMSPELPQGQELVRFAHSQAFGAGLVPWPLMFCRDVLSRA